MSKIAEQIRISFEDKIKEQILNHSGIDSIKDYVKDFNQKKLYDNYHRYALKNGIRLDKHDYEKIYSLTDEICDFLSINPSITFFKLKETGNENAYLVSYEDNIIIGLCSNILNLITDPLELKSIIAHEIGQYIYKHNENEIINYLNNIIELNEDDFDKDEKDFFETKEGDILIDLACVLGQINKLNADRIALIATQNLRSTAVALMKLIAGPVGSFGTYNPGSYIQQADELMKMNNYFTTDDLSTSQPIESLRVKALEYFYNSDLFYSLTEKGGNIYNAEGFADLLPNFVPLELITLSQHENIKTQGDMPEKTPSTIDTSHEDSYDYDLFLYLAIIEVISADGVIAPKEQWFMSRLIRNEDHYQKIVKETGDLSDEEHSALFGKQCEIAKSFTTKDKLTIIKLLIRAARTDHNFDESESEKIQQIAAKINAMDECRTQYKNHLNRDI